MWPRRSPQPHPFKLPNDFAMEPSSSQPGQALHRRSPRTSQSPGIGRVAAPTRVLHSLLTQSLTGRLQISHLSQSLPNWSIYLAQGEIQFATGDDSRGDRLAYLLQRSCRQILPPSGKPLRKAARAPYDYLHHCWKQEKITLQELRSLLRSSSQEALVHCLAMAQGRVQFERGVMPTPTLISSDLDELATPLEAHIGQWQSLSQKRIYPYGRISLLRGSRFAEQFGGPIQAISRRQGLLDWQSLFAGQPSLYGIAAQLNADLLPVARLMNQAVKLGYLRWQTQPAAVQSPSQGIVACLDSSNAVQQQVRQSLEPLGYRVIGLSHSQQALSILVKERPNLILMDGALAVEEEKGLGHLLRESTLLRHIPLILLTPHDSLINPMRTKAAGAQAWIVKPLEEASLVKAVKRWTALRSPSQVA